MAKKRLFQIAKECGVPFEEALELAFQHLEEDMITGGKHLTWINEKGQEILDDVIPCLLYTSPSPRDGLLSRMPSSA